MQIDPWILAFSVLAVVATIWMGFWAARKSKTAHDFYVAGRSVSVGWNASAISGEYLSAASFMGVAGMVMSSGYDALWYPVCYACGYLFLLLFIAGPLRRFGAYTIPDFAEGRFDSPLFRKIAVCFVLFIGFFYTMPQMKGAGTALAYIFKGLPYEIGVILVGVVITFNVALGGMKGITLVQAFQYWLKMFAISVPIFILMAVYGHYGKQLGFNKAKLPHPETIPDYSATDETPRKSLPEKAPKDSTWINPFGPLTTKAAKAAVATPISNNQSAIPRLKLAVKVDFVTVFQGPTQVNRLKDKVEGAWDEKVTKLRGTGAGSAFGSETNTVHRALYAYAQDHWCTVLRVADLPDTIIRVPTNAYPQSEFGDMIERVLATNGVVLLHEEEHLVKAVPAAMVETTTQTTVLSADQIRPYALLYTYSLIIALVCGTAGLPHILVRFYTNPNGVAAKRTTMWVMILIGVFYLFPPVFGVMGRNLMPDLYAATGAKGTDKVVLELPRILNETGSAPAPGAALSALADRTGATDEASAATREGARAPQKKRFPWGSLLSGITCAGAFAAFMSTFSGLLVSLTGALAHDVYGRMLNPKSTPHQRVRMFKVCAVLCGSGAILLGFFVEKFEINKMVGWAFAIAATSYFPLLFLSTWWRGITMKGAATGMLVGGTFSLVAIASTMFADQAPWAKGLANFYAGHPLLRILAEQPAIWALPLAIILMVFVSKLTRTEVPADIRMKMLVLHAPEKLGLKQEYIQEHQAR